MKIKVPQTLNDCTPEQLSKWVYLTTGDIDLESLMGKLEFRVQVLAIFSGLSKDEIRSFDYRDVNRVFVHIVSILTTYEPSEPKGEVIINNQRYIFDKEFNHKTTGQIIDIKLIEDVHKEPLKVLSALYIEEGMEYNQLNERNQVINPSQERERVFKEFDGVEFLNVFAFFLTKYEKLKTATFILQMAKMKKTEEEIREELKTLNGTNGLPTS